MIESLELSFEEIDKGMSAFLEEYRKMKKADIMFCLDCTGSMKEAIDAVKYTISEFPEMVEKVGIFIRIGLIEFRDRLHGEEHKVHNFNGQIFTKDMGLFIKAVSMLKAEGGHDEPESSLDAVMLACVQPFGNDAAKVVVLITDAPPHIPDKETKTIEEVVERIKDSGIDLFYCVVNASDERSGNYLLLADKREAVYDLGMGDDFMTVSDSIRKMLFSMGKSLTENLY